MKPFYEEISTSINSSFSLKRDIMPYINVPLHFHPEFEWVLNLRGDGKRFVGDGIGNFRAGDLVLLGEFLPHYWKNDREHYVENSKKIADLIIVHFKKDAFGPDFFSLPEMGAIHNLLKKSTRGIAFSGKTNVTLTEKLLEMTALNGIERLLHLLEILHVASKNEKDWEILSTSNYSALMSRTNDQRLQKVFQFVSENYNTSFSLEKIAAVVDMNTAAFCRYFKKTTGKGFNSYVNEVRINYAKKLLHTYSTPIKDVGYACGFFSSSYFIKKFKASVGMTPFQYRQKIAFKKTE